MKACVVYNNGTALNYDPSFERGDIETRKFATHSQVALGNGGVTLAISEDVDKRALDEAIRILTEYRHSE